MPGLRSGAPTSGGAAGVQMVSPARERLGPVFLLALLWLLFEFGRPWTPPGLPFLITVILLVDWLGKKNKQWSRHSHWWLALLLVVASGTAFAPNTYAAFFSTRLMATLFLGMCLPLQALISSVKKARAWIYTFIAVAFYVGGWAATHGGFGPAASAGQDENYVAALMGMAIALAYFSLLSEERMRNKIMLGIAMVAYIAAMALGQNPSRGGFLGLLTVAAYCLMRSPRKLVGIGVLGGAGVALLLIAGPAFWAEIGTSTDYKTGTGDLRLEVWKAGVRMWQANPVLGVGAGNFRWVIGDFQSEEQFEKFGRSLGGSIVAHSLPVELLAELGALGVLATAMLIWRTWTGLGKLRQERPRRGQPPVHPDLIRLGYFADGIRAAILAVLVNGVFLSLLYYSHLWVLLAVGSALPFVHRRVLAQHGPGGVVPQHARQPPPAANRGTAAMPNLPTPTLPHLGAGRPS